MTVPNHQTAGPVTRLVMLQSQLFNRFILRQDSGDHGVVDLLAGLLALAVITARARLHFLQQPLELAILDIVALAIFVALSTVHRKWLYVGFITLLPAASLTYIPAGLLPHDLTSVIALLVVGLLVRPQRKEFLPASFRYALVFYAALSVYLLGFLSFESFYDIEELKAQFKAVYFLATAFLAAWLFARIYRAEDWPWLMYALRIGIYAYLFSAALGYLYPLTSFTWEAGSGFYFKSLFRYPGMSSSNYVANLLLLMIAMHAHIARANGQRVSIAWYGGLLFVVAVLSQSRGFVVGAVIYLGVWWMKSLINGSDGRTKRRLSPARLLGLGAVLALALAGGAIFLGEFFVALSGQFLERFGGLAVANIDARVAEWRDTVAFFETSGSSLLNGYHKFPEAIRPHNLTLTAVLLFGVPVAIFIMLAFLLLALVFPQFLFVFVVAQTEILFGTGLYDAMFLIFILIAARPPRATTAVRGRLYVPGSGL